MTAIKLDNITVSIAKKLICKALTLDIGSGEIWGILGANGSGKTTLLHALSGFYPLTHGKIFFHHEALGALSPQALAKKRAILFQDSHFVLPQTVWEYCQAARYPHLSFFEKIRAHDIEIVHHALKIVELDHCHNQLITQLSGGEKRRLAIAAQLAQNTSIFLLDEPNNHLDIKHQINILNYFHSLAKTQSTTIVMTLHDVHLARKYCDQVMLLLPNGEIKTGKTAALLTTHQLSELYQLTTKNSDFYFGTA